ncbi:MAG: cation diffusion facilitator family transporter [Planctomycetes bacterium]|nr:cation diffusion facilitator family transporter [Planctomycetota bacterium]
MNQRTFAISLSLAAALAMLAGKWAAFTITGSQAILSDAAESVVHLAATAIAAFSLWYSLQPADQQHPYGHGRIAFFSAGLEGGLILLAALAVAYSAVVALIRGHELRELNVGVAIIAALGVVNLALGWFLVRTGKRHNSLVLVANGRHVLTDMGTSVGVVAGVGVVAATDLVWLDAAIALVLAGVILWSAFGLLRDSFNGLMDRVDPAVTAAIHATLAGAVADGTLAGYHQLRHRLVENQLWLEVHMLMSGELSLYDAHEKVNLVENRLREALPEFVIHVTTHLEPKEHASVHPHGHETADPLAPIQKSGAG